MADGSPIVGNKETDITFTIVNRKIRHTFLVSASTHMILGMDFIKKNCLDTDFKTLRIRFGDEILRVPGVDGYKSGNSEDNRMIDTLD